MRNRKERRALEVNRASKPCVIHAPRVTQRYAEAAASLKGPVRQQLPRFLGRGHKLVILFDFDDREKMLLRTDEETGAPVYVNPLDPPADPGHPCWGATCYFLELRADLGDTLVIPAGMLHWVLTVEDSSLVCVEMASPLPAELSASLKVVQTVRRLQEIPAPGSAEAFEFYDRWRDAGFDVPTMLHQGIGLATDVDGGGDAAATLTRYREWLGQEACAERSFEKLGRDRCGDYQRVLLHVILAGEQRNQRVSQEKREKAEAAAAKQRKRADAEAKRYAEGRVAEWQRESEETERVTLYHSGMSLQLSGGYNDDRGHERKPASASAAAEREEMLVQGKRGRKEAAKFLGGEAAGAEGEARAKAVFFEGFQSKGVALALDVEKCGSRCACCDTGPHILLTPGRPCARAGDIIHGCTSLLLQERGAVTQLHFDTGPYSAISMHLCQDVHG